MATVWFKKKRDVTPCLLSKWASLRLRMIFHVNDKKYDGRFNVCQSNMADLTSLPYFTTIMLFNMAAASLFWKTNMVALTWYDLTILIGSNIADISLFINPIWPIRRWHIVLLHWYYSIWQQFPCFGNPKWPSWHQGIILQYCFVNPIWPRWHLHKNFSFYYYSIWRCFIVMPIQHDNLLCLGIT